MPRLDATGSYAVMSGSGPVTVTYFPPAGNPEQPANPEQTVVCSRGTCASWYDAESQVVAYQTLDGPATIELYQCQSKVHLPLWPRGCNELATGGRRLVAWLGGYGLFGDLGHRPLSGLSPVGTDGRGSCAPDGTVAIVRDRDSGVSLELHSAQGDVVVVPGLAPYGVRVLGAGQATWNGGSVGVDVSRRLPGGQNGVRLVDQQGRIWWVEWRDQGLVAYIEGESFGYLLARDRAFHHDAVVSRDGRIVVAYSTGVGELPHELVRIADVTRDGDHERPRVNLMASPIVAVNKPMWFGWFEFPPFTADGTGPGNCWLSVESKLVRSTLDGHVIAQYIDAEKAGNTPEAYEQQIAQARRQYPGVPIVAYWPPGAAAQSYIPPVEWVGVEAYWKATESASAFESRVRTAVARCPRVALVAQCYTSNSSNVTDLPAVVPILARIARDCANVDMVLAFSNRGRATGLADHPEALPAWQTFFAGVTGEPKVVVPARPRITISSYNPSTGRSPLDVAVSVGVPTESGPIDSIVWLYRRRGAPTWTQAAVTQAEERTHTYTFGEGIWELSVAVVGPGGNDRTEMERLVEVLAPMPADNDDVPVEDDPMYSVEKFEELYKLAAKIVSAHLPISFADAEQGAREMGDRFKKAQKNPTVWELCSGAVFRYTGFTHKEPEYEQFDAMLAEAIAEQERLRR